MNPDNRDAGSRGTIRFLQQSYPGNITIAPIRSQHDLVPFRIAVDVSMTPTEELSAHADFLADAAPPSCRRAQKPEGTDAVKHAIMTDTKLSHATSSDTGDYRMWLLGRFRQQVPNLAGVIRQACDELAEVGLLRGQAPQKKRGRRVQSYRKVTWDELTDAAKSEADRFRIPRSIFEGACGRQ